MGELFAEVTELTPALLLDPINEYCAVSPAKPGPLAPFELMLTGCEDEVELGVAAAPAKVEDPLEVLAVILSVKGVRFLRRLAGMHPFGSSFSRQR